MPPRLRSPAIGGDNPERIQSLDGLRGIAILMVMAHHFFVLTPDNPLARRVAGLTEFCGHGVDLFFSISGFLIVRQLSRFSGEEHWTLKFWTHRFSKIVPLYFACITFVFALLPRLLAFTGHDREWQLQEQVHRNWPWYALFVSNFLNARDGRFTNPAIDVAWSLGVEIQFYIFIFLAFLMFGRRLTRWLVLGVPVAILCRCLAVRGGDNWIQILVLPWNRLDAFALGAVAATRSFRFLGSFRLLFVLTLPVLAAMLDWSRDSSFVETAGYTLVAIAALFSISLAVDGGSAVFTRTLNARPLRLAGALSYPIYLIHLPIRAFIRNVLFPGDRILAGALSWFQITTYYVICGAVCVGLGWLLYTMFEDPLRRKINAAIL